MLNSKLNPTKKSKTKTIKELLEKRFNGNLNELKGGASCTVRPINCSDCFIIFKEKPGPAVCSTDNGSGNEGMA